MLSEFNTALQEISAAIPPARLKGDSRAVREASETLADALQDSVRSIDDRYERWLVVKSKVRDQAQAGNYEDLTVPLANLEDLSRVFDEMLGAVTFWIIGCERKQADVPHIYWRIQSRAMHVLEVIELMRQEIAGLNAEMCEAILRKKLDGVDLDELSPKQPTSDELDAIRREDWSKP